MIKTNIIYNEDCLQGLEYLPDKCIDLIVTDPPYVLDGGKSGKSALSARAQNINRELKNSAMVNGFNKEVLDELVRVMKKINIYIFCSTKQITDYCKYFVDDYKCSLDILLWNKTNPTPTFNGHYLPDCEFILLFREKGAKCKPGSYEKAKKVFRQKANTEDKKLYMHPTIKPLNIISTLIENSSKQGDIILDPFIGTGTTAVASKQLNRQYIGYEINQQYFNTAQKRISDIDNKEKK